VSEKKILLKEFDFASRTHSHSTHTVHVFDCGLVDCTEPEAFYVDQSVSSSTRAIHFLYGGLTFWEANPLMVTF